MSAAAAAATVETAPPVKGGKKKLIVIGAAALLVLVLVAAAAVWWLKSRAAHAAELAEADDAGATPNAVAKADAARPPTFLPLEAFVVNLADRDADRYAQIGITLEVESSAFAEQMKAYMPAIRNSVLMILAHKTSRQLLDRAGKEDLAGEIMREAVRPMGIEIAAPQPVTLAASAAAAASEPASGAASSSASASASAPLPDKPKRRADVQKNPVRHVHFSSFIIQ